MVTYLRWAHKNQAWGDGHWTFHTAGQTCFLYYPSHAPQVKFWHLKHVLGPCPCELWLTLSLVLLWMNTISPFVGVSYSHSLTNSLPRLREHARFWSYISAMILAMWDSVFPLTRRILTSNCAPLGSSNLSKAGELSNTVSNQRGWYLVGEELSRR